ncbi:HNH endonuclease signature motif containing protein [Mucilaginibacter sp. dw_454]|uniref:HNH endonuclease signature motif containing protein n=1 Tax=Mucilaginibacter sp. dw_454 TaxID=2720079 RepID=UPI001BD3817E|nr:HNH endonuclease signature motif containing protein [Mucilaginibacter sp. dw_454]
MPKHLWILKSKGEKSSFGGNDGYDDKPDAYYIYDNFVPNHNKLKEGDYVLIADKKYLHGFAVVDHIAVTEGLEKKRYSCPVCGIKEHSARKTKTPKYKCRKGHEFETLNEEITPIREYRADYSTSFINLPEKTSVQLLNKYYMNRNRYYSIQRAMPSFLEELFPDLLRQLGSPAGVVLRPYMTTDPYKPSEKDERAFRTGRSYYRPDQSKFRSDLFGYYGIKCMLTDCTVATALEASHICCYRGDEDNHCENGLLLRRDLHALYDADLLGICPSDLKVVLSRELMNTEYSKFNGVTLDLNNSGCRPSTGALEIRWKVFLEKSQRSTVPS